jgi:hypothetical protein
LAGPRHVATTTTLWTHLRRRHSPRTCSIHNWWGNRTIIPEEVVVEEEEEEVANLRIIILSTLADAELFWKIVRLIVKIGLRMLVIREYATI